jgi:hypothetical protein
LFASGAERAYHAGLLAYLGNDSTAALASFEKVVASDPAAMSAHMFAGVAASVIGDSPRSIVHLEAVVGSQHGRSSARRTGCRTATRRNTCRHPCST